MKAILWAICLIIILTVSASAETSILPPDGKLLHGVYPGGKSGFEGDITPADVQAYEDAVGHSADWVYFSDNWFANRNFPAKKTRWIRERGSIPYIRLMMRSDAKQNHAEPVFTLRAIGRGKFDSHLAEWGRRAARFKTPIIVEFGTEMNGRWFPWNAVWNKRKQGAPRFVKTYRHIIDVMRGAGADNITWVFHVNNNDYPNRSWNKFEAYYPGDDYIDWLALSVYSMLGPHKTEATKFTPSVDRVMKRLVVMAPDKPVIVAEFGTDVNNPNEPAAKWANKALGNMIGGRWPALIGFSWWNETWQNDDNAENDTDIRVQSSPALAKVFKRHLKMMAE